jgi:hypothetical protein
MHNLRSHARRDLEMFITAMCLLIELGFYSIVAFFWLIESIDVKINDFLMKKTAVTSA